MLKTTELLTVLDDKKLDDLSRLNAAINQSCFLSGLYYGTDVKLPADLKGFVLCRDLNSIHLRIDIPHPDTTLYQNFGAILEDELSNAMYGGYVEKN